jgi:hypothetical protein
VARLLIIYIKRAAPLHLICAGFGRNASLTMTYFVHAIESGALLFWNFMVLILIFNNINLIIIIINKNCRKCCLERLSRGFFLFGNENKQWKVVALRDSVLEINRPQASFYWKWKQTGERVAAKFKCIIVILLNFQIFNPTAQIYFWWQIILSKNFFQAPFTRSKDKDLQSCTFPPNYHHPPITYDLYKLMQPQTREKE